MVREPVPRSGGVNQGRWFSHRTVCASVTYTEEEGQGEAKFLFWLAYFYVWEFRFLVESIVIIVRDLFRSGGTLRTS